VFGVDPVAVGGKRLRTDPAFLRHTTMFTDTLDFVIRNLDDWPLVTENAEQLGRYLISFFMFLSFRISF
jgi:hypothetical protein